MFSIFSPFVRTPLLLVLFSIGLPMTVFGQHNFCVSPSVPSCCYDETVDGHPLVVVPSDRWDDLSPGNILADNTAFKWGVGGCDLGSMASIWLDMAVANNLIFTAAQERVEAWNIASASSPTLSWTKAPSTIFPYWLTGSDTNDKIVSTDGVHDPVSGKTIVGLSAKTFGFAAFIDGGSGAGLYEDTAGRAVDVYTTVIGGRAYGFGAFSDTGVIAYDLSSAANLSGVCENTQGTAPSGCTGSAPGVYESKLPGTGNAWNVGGAGNYVAARTGQSKGLAVWDVSNPSSPSLKIHDDVSQLNGNGEVVMWIDGGTPYLATAVRDPSTKLKIYNLGCLTTSSCSATSFPSPTILSIDAGSGFKYGVRYGLVDGDPHIYTFSASHGAGSCLVQREWIFDVSNASNPVEVNNPSTTSDSYYSWYYEECVGDPNVDGGGFQHLTPTGGGFNNGYLYRSLFTALDQHSFGSTGSAPTANFTWTAPSCTGSGPSCQPFEGEQVDFTDTSSGSPPVDQWSWAFSGGSPSISTTQHPQNVVFSSQGVKSVSLDATNTFGSDNIQQNVTILDASPSDINVTGSIDPALACQPVTFTATAGTGVPPLDYSWSVTGPESVDPGDLSGASTSVMTWTIDGAQTSGNYTVRADVSNIHGSDFDNTILQVLPITGPATLSQSAPSVDSVNGLQATFSISSTQTTKWSWNFDYPGGAWVDYTDPIQGPNPTHSYAIPGFYDVRVRVSNCVNTTPVESDSVQVEATDEPLALNTWKLADFATCPSFGGCEFTMGQSVNFTLEYDGTPTSVEFDWDVDGVYEEYVNNPGSNPISHKFCETTDPFNGFRPRVRMRKNLEDPLLSSMMPLNGIHIAAGTACSLPGAPSSLTANAVGSTISVSWTAGSGSVGHRLLRTDGSMVGGEIIWLHIATTTSGQTSHSDTTAVEGVTYTYKAYAYNNDGVGDYSNSDSAQVHILVPIFSDGFESGDPLAWNAVSEMPPVAKDDDFSVGEDDVSTIEDLFADNGHGIDLDPDGGSISIVAVDGVPGDVGQVLVLPSGADYTVTSLGGLTFNVNAGYETLALGSTAQEIFEYTLEDNESDQDTAQVTITINGANDAPLVVDDPVGITEDEDDFFRHSFERHRRRLGG